MNTREINDSAWPIRYYVVVAAPLTVVSVMLPLVALQLLEAYSRLKSTTAFRQAVTWGVISTTSVINLVLDIRGLTSMHDTSFSIFSLQFVVCLSLPSWLATEYLMRFFWTIRQEVIRSGEDIAYWKRVFRAISAQNYWPLFYFLATLVYIFLYLFGPTLSEFIPLSFYVLIRLYLWARAKWLKRAS